MCESRALLHHAVTESDVEDQCSFAERLGQVTIVRVVQMVVHLEADPKHRVGGLVSSLTDFEQGLAEVPA